LETLYEYSDDDASDDLSYNEDEVELQPVHHNGASKSASEENRDRVTRSKRQVDDDPNPRQKKKNRTMTLQDEPWYKHPVFPMRRSQRGERGGRKFDFILFFTS